MNFRMTGDLLHVSAIGTHIIIINSLKIAEDLFEGRAKLYNDRPQIPIIKL